jgi:hypothetical protein
LFVRHTLCFCFLKNNIDIIRQYIFSKSESHNNECEFLIIIINSLKKISFLRLSFIYILFSLYQDSLVSMLKHFMVCYSVPNLGDYFYSLFQFVFFFFSNGDFYTYFSFFYGQLFLKEEKISHLSNLMYFILILYLI